MHRQLQPECLASYKDSMVSMACESDGGALEDAHTKQEPGSPKFK